jgi:TldD protein
LLKLAQSRLLEPAGLSLSDLQEALGLVASAGVDDADLYFQSGRSESWSLEDGTVKDGAHSIEQGVGVRALTGEKTGFAYSDELSRDALLEAARAARAIARQGGQGAPVQAFQAREGKNLYLADDPVATRSDPDKVAFLEYVDRYARAQDPRVKQVMASVVGSHEVILVAALDGTLAADVRPFGAVFRTALADE